MTVFTVKLAFNKFCKDIFNKQLTDQKIETNNNTSSEFLTYSVWKVKKKTKPHVIWYYDMNFLGFFLELYDTVFTSFSPSFCNTTLYTSPQLPFKFMTFLLSFLLFHTHKHT